jgi:hypothetical protein
LIWQLSFPPWPHPRVHAEIEHFIHERTGIGSTRRTADRTSADTLAQGMEDIIRLFSAGTAAWLGNAGILLYHFYTVTPLASLWTVFASIPVAAIVTLGFLKIVLSFILPASMILAHSAAARDLFI